MYCQVVSCGTAAVQGFAAGRAISASFITRFVLPSTPERSQHVVASRVLMAPGAAGADGTRRAPPASRTGRPKCPESRIGMLL
jgi:hypothetical protein